MPPYWVRRDHEAGDAVLVLALNRPERANAYTRDVLGALNDALDRLEDSATRALILTGTGERAFCAGADLAELATHRFADAFSLTSRAIFDRIASLPILTVAAVNGAARGGGVELALACDIRVCAPRATFAFPELDHGLIPAAGGSRRLPALIGAGRARHMILSAEAIDASRALSWGLVTHCGEDYLDYALRLATAAAARDRDAVRSAKRVLDPTGSDLESIAQATLYERRARRGEE